ncbi:MAG: hypothetical protein LBF71_06005 [Campylobacteraceae bacterium]|nr:hypothetical protein [Campylobacteraceae bacterium]
MLNQKRDYDKNPIVIKDYNYTFIALFGLIFLCYGVYALFMPQSYSPAIWSIAMGGSVICISFFFRGYKKRKIILSNDSIKFIKKNYTLHEYKIIEKIKLNEITDIRKTYNEISHKTEMPTDLQHLFSITLFVTLPIFHPFFILIKLFFHIFKDGISSYRFFDAVMIFNNDRLINILPTTKKEYEDIRIF